VIFLLASSAGAGTDEATLITASAALSRPGKSEEYDRATEDTFPASITALCFGREL